MKVAITHMKAPWPAGAAIGDVVEVGDAVPGCFVGKCKPADDGAEAAHAYEAPAPLALTVAEPAKPVDPDAMKIAEALLADARVEVDELRARMSTAEQALAAKTTECEAAVKRATDAEQALAAKKK